MGGGLHLPMLVRELERLHQPHSLHRVAPNRQICDLSPPHNALVADDEGAAQGNALVAIRVLLYAVVLHAMGGQPGTCKARRKCSVTWQIL